MFAVPALNTWNMYLNPVLFLLVELIMNLIGLYAGVKVCGDAMVVCAIILRLVRLVYSLRLRCLKLELQTSSVAQIRFALIALLAPRLMLTFFLF